jgi:site-specific DNA-methyltransferase (adenine-specific)
VKVYRGKGWEIREGRWQDSPPDSVPWWIGAGRSGGWYPAGVVIIGDPPYDEATHKGHALGARARKAVQFDPIDPKDVAPELLRIAERWVVLFCADLQVSEYGKAVGGHRVIGGGFVRMGAWVKLNPAPQFSGDRPGTWCEPIAIMHPPRSMYWNGGGHAGCWTHASAHGSERLHETPKPIDLMLDLVAAFSDPGELVWDPYCGSGTTGVACMRLGRRFLGHEMQPHYAAVAAERLAAEERHITLQADRAGQTSIYDVIGDDK